MINRYQKKELAEIWSDAERFKTWFKIEIAYLQSYLSVHELKNLDLIERLNKACASINWPQLAKKIEIYEEKTHHDVIAFLCALEDELKEDARLIHITLTSSDIVDTAFALLLRRAAWQIEKSLKELLIELWLCAQKYQGLICLGRTHGQAAEPTTLGIKMLSHLCELRRGHERLLNAIEDISVGKFSGVVGVYSLSDPEIEKKALSSLSLSIEPVATQIVARDRHASFFTALAVLAGSLERLAVEIRLLMHGQVKEVYEPFGSEQKGSSAMPHKKNPVLTENISGLMRLVRSYAMAALENQALWHERDISHSSVERVIAPDASSIMDYALQRMTKVIKGLVVDKERIQANLSKESEHLYSQIVLLRLIEAGARRQEAYEIVQKAALSDLKNYSFKDALINHGASKFLSKDKLEQIFCEAEFQVPHEKILFERAKVLLENIVK